MTEKSISTEEKLGFPTAAFKSPGDLKKNILTPEVQGEAGDSAFLTSSWVTDAHPAGPGTTL